ncbi:MAG: cyclophilin-like fold protein [Syntrophobacteraceae bacterium]
MGKRIRIRAGSVSLPAELSDTPTARAILSALPLSAEASTWGEEIYFAIPVKETLDDTAVEVVEVGDLGYWPHGSAFCVFFGPTPISKGAEIRPASAVNRVGRVLGDARLFRAVNDGDPVELSLERHGIEDACGS